MNLSVEEKYMDYCIKCPHCGRQNIPDTEERCPQCKRLLKEPEASVETGSPININVAEAPKAVSAYPRTHKPIKVNIGAAIGLLIGIAFIIIGYNVIKDAFISRFSILYGEGHLRDVKFGGDFYTEIYNGVRVSEIDLNYIGSAIVKLIKAVGVLICSVGASTVAVSLIKIKK